MEGRKRKENWGSYRHALKLLNKERKHAGKGQATGLVEKEGSSKPGGEKKIKSQQGSQLEGGRGSRRTSCGKSRLVGRKSARDRRNIRARKKHLPECE